MADFKVSAEIEMQAKQALNEIDKINKATQNTKREFNLLGKTLTLDTKRIASGLKKITAISGAMFGAMALASPSMRAAFKQIELSAFVLSLELGEHLAPMIEDTLVPAMTFLSDTVLALDDDKQTLIATTIALTFVLGLLAIAIVAVTWEFVLVALAIVALALLIAGLIVYWDDITEAVEDFINKIPGIENFVAAIIDLKDTIVTFWNIVKPIFKIAFLIALTAILPALALIALGFVGIVTAIMLIIPAVTFVIRIFTTLLHFVVGIMETIKLALTGNFDEAFLKIKETFTNVFKDMFSAIKGFMGDVKDVFSTVIGGIVGLAKGALSGMINTLIDFINEMVVDTLNKIPGVNIDHIPRIGETEATYGGTGGTTSTGLVRKQEGGTIDRTGLIFAHKGEEIMRPVEARQFREQRTSRSSGNTYIFHNTYKIGSINNRSQMLAYARESAAMQKNEMNRRFHA